MPRWEEIKTVTCGTETLPLGEWAKRLGRDAATLHYRYERGWTPEQILELAPQPKRAVRTVTYGDETLTLKQWSDRTGITNSTLHQRYIGGYTPAQILGLEPLPEMAGGFGAARVYTRSDGISGTVPEWSGRLGRSAETIYSRLRRGWGVDRALELGWIDGVEPVPKKSHE